MVSMETRACISFW